jgi:hypothetical protein
MTVYTRFSTSRGTASSEWSSTSLPLELPKTHSFDQTRLDHHVSWIQHENHINNAMTMDDDDESESDEHQAAEILTSLSFVSPDTPGKESITLSKASISTSFYHELLHQQQQYYIPYSEHSYEEPSLIQSDSMDGHVDPVSCQLMREDDDGLMDQEQRLLHSQSHPYASCHDTVLPMQSYHHHYNSRQTSSSPVVPRIYSRTAMLPLSTLQRPQAHRLQLFAMPSRSYEEE